MCRSGGGDPSPSHMYVYNTQQSLHNARGYILEALVRRLEAGICIVQALPDGREDALAVAGVHVQEDVHHCVSVFCMG